MIPISEHGNKVTLSLHTTRTPNSSLVCFAPGMERERERNTGRVFRLTRGGSLQCEWAASSTSVGGGKGGNGAGFLCISSSDWWYCMRERPPASELTVRCGGRDGCSPCYIIEIAPESCLSMRRTEREKNNHKPAYHSKPVKCS